MSHPLLRALKANKPALGVWLTNGGYIHARTVAQAHPNLSWVAIDCEHGLLGLSGGSGACAEVVAGIHGANPSARLGGAGGGYAGFSESENAKAGGLGGGITGIGPSALVRIPATGVTGSTSWQIKYALDAGARGVIVPMVSTVAKAREIVSDARFPPVGRRGFGNPYTQDSWGITTKDYLEKANDEVLVMAQIETKEGVENLEAIAKVPGLDVLFIGPYDLSLSLGYAPPSPDPHPDVETVIQKILKISHDEGKKCAIYCTTGPQAAKRVKEGFDMVNVISDVGALTSAISEHLSQAMA